MEEGGRDGSKRQREMFSYVDRSTTETRERRETQNLARFCERILKMKTTGRYRVKMTPVVSWVLRDRFSGKNL